MPIHPLPQFEADVADYERERRRARLAEAGVSEAEIEQLVDLPEDDRRVYAKLSAPKTLVVRFGVTMMVGEFPYRGSAKPGCGSKVVVRTHRGTEVGEMLTSTCPNSGCGKSVSRKEMLDYIENSGGRQYPFFQDGKVLRIATQEDLDAQARIEQSKHALRMEAKAVVERHGLNMKVVDVEPILGAERVTVYFGSEDRIDFRELSRDLSAVYRTRVDLRQVGARDEARISADYEKCGQYCCCKNFLKVLKPISMRSAKVQKATLDPMKISGRCGRLMCCLRYEDETYNELRKKLPNRKKRVGTPDGDGIVIDTQILTQLALILLDNGERVAVPVEELGEPGQVAPREKPQPVAQATETAPEPTRKRKRKAKRTRSRDRDDAGSGSATGSTTGSGEDTGSSSQTRGGPATNAGEAPTREGEPGKKKRRRRRRRKPSAEGGGTDQGMGQGTDQSSEGGASKPPRERSGGRSGEGSAEGSEGPASASSAGSSSGGSGEGEGSAPRKRKRRRRRRRGSGEGGSSSEGGAGDPGGGGSDS